jgi:hypothetical protein
MSALAGWEKLLAERAAQRKRVVMLDQARKVRPREHELERAEEREQVRARERDGDADSDALDVPRELPRGLERQVKEYTNEGGGRDLRVEIVDVGAEERFEGARERLLAIENEMRRYVRAHLDDMAVERAPRAQQVGEQCKQALQLVAEAAGTYESELSWWRMLLVWTVGEGDEHTAARDVPTNVFRDVPPAASVQLPMPERFVNAKQP